MTVSSIEEPAAADGDSPKWVGCILNIHLVKRKKEGRRDCVFQTDTHDAGEREVLAAGAGDG